MLQMLSEHVFYTHEKVVKNLHMPGKKTNN